MKKKKKTAFLSLRFMLGTGLVLFTGFMLWSAINWANYRHLFHLEKIRISGTQIQPRDFYRQLLGPLDQLDLTDINLEEVRLLLESDPFVKAARVSRQYPGYLNIEIVERKPLALLNLKPILLVDDEGVILPDNGYSQKALIPVLSGFNPARELYPPGRETFSLKVKETVEILKQLLDGYPELYEQLSEVTLNEDDEYVFILAEHPTKVILGKEDIWNKIKILKQFELALKGQRHLTDYKLLDMRDKKQVIAREWT